MTRLRNLLLSALGILALSLGLLHGWSIHQHAENEKLAQNLLKQITAAPNDTRLQTNICALLDTGDISIDTGNSLLKTLVSQHLIQRETYLAGHDVNVRVFVDSRPSFQFYAFGFNVKAMASDECLGSVERTISTRGVDCEFYRGTTSGGKVLSTEAAGDYGGLIRFTYSLYKRASRHWYWPSYRPFPKNLLPGRERFGRPSATPTYQCEISMPVRLRVVAIPEIEWTNSPELDDKVTNSFTLDPTGWLKARQQPAPMLGPQAFFRRTGDTNSSFRYPDAISTSQEMDSDILLWVSNAPINLAFVTSFRDPTGVEYPSKALRITVKKSQRWSYILQEASDDFGLPSGHYKGDLILKADKSVAYDSLYINDIWNGTLSFPVEFDIKPKPAK
jgi:hypothetical protein